MNNIKELIALKPNSIFDYLGAIFLIVLFFGGSTYVWKLINTPTSEPVAPIIKKITTCEGTFEEYTKLLEKGQSIVLTKNQWSHVLTGSGFVGDKKVIARRGGEVACGYLFVRAHKGNSPLSEKWDSIYINPQGLGGHLLRTRSIKLNSESSTSTQVLFSLSSVPYLPNVPYNPEAQNFETTNWVKLINSASKIEFWVALSTLNQGAVIDEATIVYRCWNPDTLEETTDCQLSIDAR